MGQLYDLRVKIEKTIEEKSLDPFKTKGEIGLNSGVMLSMLHPETPDDPTKVEKLKAAAQEVLKIAI